MNSYLNGRLGRQPVGSAAMPVSSGVTATASISAGSGGDGTAPIAITILAVVGGLVVFYWATRSIQGSR